jgi:hypothetical protein
MPTGRDLVNEPGWEVGEVTRLAATFSNSIPINEEKRKGGKSVSSVTLATRDGVQRSLSTLG